MADDIDPDQNQHGDHKWLTEWEHKCIQELDNEGKMEEERLQNDLESTSQHLWFAFQNSATAIAQLYKDRCRDSVSLWVPFQNSASSVTILYRDSLESSKRMREASYQLGQQKRNRDVLNWVKKRRRHIRRDELISFLTGKPLPLRTRPTAALGRSSARAGVDIPVNLTHVNPSRPLGPDETNLEPFRDALALQRLDGAMSNINMGYNTSGSTLNPNSPDSDEAFHCFLVDEMTRRCEGARKRNAASNDVVMDSPTRKRSRLL